MRKRFMPDSQADSRATVSRSCCQAAEVYPHSNSWIGSPSSWAAADPLGPASLARITTGRDAQLPALGSHRGQGMTRSSRHFLIPHGAKERQMLLRPWDPMRYDRGQFPQAPSDHVITLFVAVLLGRPMLVRHIPSLCRRGMDENLAACIVLPSGTKSLAPFNDSELANSPPVDNCRGTLMLDGPGQLFVHDQAGETAASPGKTTTARPGDWRIAP